MKRIQQDFSVRYSYPVFFTRDAFSESNPVLKEILYGTVKRKSRILTVIDSEVLRLTIGFLEKFNRFIEVHADEAEFLAPPMVMGGGEACKNGPAEAQRIHAVVEENGLCRHSFILAIGGGAVLDATGFAAATAHRGIRLIRMPTTTLAMNDAGVGVKNGINAFGRKNFTGCFAPPYAVINDFDFLDRLPERELRSGIAEAVKVALIRDKAFFDFLHDARGDLAAFLPRAMQRMIIRCAELHLEHIGSCGDPFEFGSSRPLDFGHWSAHKLEELTGGRIRHGEAVAIGIALDSLYSYRLGLVREFDLRRIFATLEGIGFELYHPALGEINVAKALKEFQEHLGGELSIPLLNGIGARLDRHDIDPGLYRRCITTLSARKKEMETRDDQTELQLDSAGDPRHLFS